MSKKEARPKSDLFSKLFRMDLLKGDGSASLLELSLSSLSVLLHCLLERSDFGLASFCLPGEKPVRSGRIR